MKKGGVIIDGKHYTEPPRKYRNDIQNLFINQNTLWVMRIPISLKNTRWWIYIDHLNI